MNWYLGTEICMSGIAGNKHRMCLKNISEYLGSMPSYSQMLLHPKHEFMIVMGFGHQNHWFPRLVAP